MFQSGLARRKSCSYEQSRPAGSPNSSVMHKEGRSKEFDELQNATMKLFNGLVDEFSTAIDAIQEKMVEMNTELGQP